MKKKIFKYTLETTDKQVVSMPSGAEILTIQAQDGKPKLWALVNPEEKQQKERHIEIFGTGHEIHYDMGVERKYLGTYQLHHGIYVYHVFEKLN